MPVTGIGGFFFRANDTDILSAWYKKHLGMGFDWQQSAGPTVFAPFKKTTDYFPAEKSSMLNLRVSGLDALLQELGAAGVPIVTKPEWDTTETGGSPAAMIRRAIRSSFGSRPPPRSASQL